ncbi:hypothetical protein [Xanthomonas graminis]|nr:hypothetical protein [Xanthomonas translucens]
MKMRFSVEDMPRDMLVPFRMKKCPSARLILCGEQLDEGTRHELLNEYGYHVLGAGDEKVFYAERYGGLGIFNNGGGVRCGLQGRYQVKGIGINSLRGRSTPAAYSSGAMGLTEAVRELVWSRILNNALPHGSPEVRAVMYLGEFSDDRKQKPQARYASIRESAWRIAHFERAQHFKPPPRSGITHDSLRVMAALGVLASRSFNSAISISHPDFPEGMLAALNSVAVKHAEQLAAARARRVMHGALSGSNSCLNGGWIDCGSIAQLPAFAAIPTFSLGFWRDYEYLFDSIKNICHGAELYSFGRFAGEGAFKKFVDTFACTYEENLAKQFCQLIGLDETFVQTARPGIIEVLVRIARRLIAVAMLGKRSAPSDPNCLQDHPSAKALELARLCGIALAHHGNGVAPQQLEFIDGGLSSDVNELAAAYRLYVTGKGISYEKACLATLITCLRRCSYVDSLDLAQMDKAIPTHEYSEKSLGAYVQTVTADAAIALNARVGWCTEIGRIGTDIYYYDPVNDIVRNDQSSVMPLKVWMESRLPQASKNIVDGLREYTG